MSRAQPRCHRRSKKKHKVADKGLPWSHCTPTHLDRMLTARGMKIEGDATEKIRRLKEFWATCTGAELDRMLKARGMKTGGNRYKRMSRLRWYESQG